MEVDDQKIILFLQARRALLLQILVEIKWMLYFLTPKQLCCAI
jgi:hypothetical protein